MEWDLALGLSILVKPWPKILSRQTPYAKPQPSPNKLKDPICNKGAADTKILWATHPNQGGVQ